MADKFYLMPLVGATIVGLVSDQDGEFFGLEVRCSDGKRKALWFLSDDEGNNPGAFDIENIA